MINMHERIIKQTELVEYDPLDATLLGYIAKFPAFPASSEMYDRLHLHSQKVADLLMGRYPKD
jgi:hypothetical protein